VLIARRRLSLEISLLWQMSRCLLLSSKLNPRPRSLLQLQRRCDLLLTASTFTDLVFKDRQAAAGRKSVKTPVYVDSDSDVEGETSVIDRSIHINVQAAVPAGKVVNPGKRRKANTVCLLAARQKSLSDMIDLLSMWLTFQGTQDNSKYDGLSFRKSTEVSNSTLSSPTPSPISCSIQPYRLGKIVVLPYRVIPRMNTESDAYLLAIKAINRAQVNEAAARSSPLFDLYNGTVNKNECAIVSCSFFVGILEADDPLVSL
jgi:hypothetical protein